MNTLLLALILSVPPQAPPLAVPPPQAPPVVVVAPAIAPPVAEVWPKLELRAGKWYATLLNGAYYSFPESEWSEKQVRAYLDKLTAPTVKAAPVASDSGEASPTPHSEIARVLALLPKPVVGFVDYGCGADARWCIAAAEKWGCKAIGVEIDPLRAAAAKERVRNSGMAHLVTIIEGDALKTDVQADVGVAYLYGEVLWDLRPKIEKLAAFASYLHHPPVPANKNGDSWIYTKPKPVVVAAPVPTWPTVAVWGGQQYTGPLCTSPNCGMCNAIRAQLSTQPQAKTGYYVKHCSNGVCWYEWVPNK